MCFERYLNNKIQSDVKIILTETGFDNKISISTLNEKNIEEIEKYVNKKKDILQNSKVYTESDVFEFKPGHRSLILSLPKKFAEYTQSEKNKPKSNNNLKNSKSDDQLKNELISKLEIFSTKRKLNLKFTPNFVTDFIKENHCYRCRIKCPLCPKKFTCTYVSHWAASNFEAHVKSHITSNPTKTESAVPQSTQTPLATPSSATHTNSSASSSATNIASTLLNTLTPDLTYTVLSTVQVPNQTSNPSTNATQKYDMVYVPVVENIGDDIDCIEELEEESCDLVIDTAGQAADNNLYNNSGLEQIQKSSQQHVHRMTTLDDELENILYNQSSNQ